MSVIYPIYAQGKFAESESLYKRAVSVGEKTLGNYHPDVAVWLNKEGEAMLEMVRPPTEWWDPMNIYFISMRVLILFIVEK